MSAPAKQVANHLATSDEEWVAWFPEDTTENYRSSAKFIKKLTVAVVSAITHSKGAFPIESYSNKTFAGLNHKILMDKCEDALAQFLSSALKRAFVAFDNKFVKRLALCFYDGDCVAEKLIEYYTFEYSFKSDGKTLSTNEAMSCSLDSVKQRTAMLFRSTWVFMNQICQTELPINYNVSLRLYYTKDCPENYQAPGFRPLIDPDHLDATTGMLLDLGWVDTPYHKLIAYAFIPGLVDSDAPAVPGCSSQSEMRQAEHEHFQAELPREPDSDSSMESCVRCPCGKQDRQGRKMLFCQYCDTLQHAVCFGLLAPARDMAHCCAACAARDPARAPTDKLLGEFLARSQEGFCLFRRTLVLCSTTAAMSGAQLQAKLQLSPTRTDKLLGLLAAHHIMSEHDHADFETPREINHLRLKQTMKQLFQMVDEEDDTADCLMMEEGQEATDPEDLVQSGELNRGSPNNAMANSEVMEDLPHNI